MIELDGGLRIPDEFLEFKFSRSAGPGGQNVNKVNTKVTLFFDIRRCDILTGWQKARILSQLGGRCTKDGLLHISSQRHRSQADNRKAVEQRLAELLNEALRQRPVRKKTKIPFSAKKRRLEAKKQRGEIKRQRSKRFELD